jgi:methylated-DNA-[protein]-cysteine S-methyltransferase
MICRSRTDSPLGELTLIAENGALIGIYFPRHRCGRGESDGEAVGDADVFAPTRCQLAEYFAGSRTEFDLPTLTHGDPFSEEVWAALREIPYGTTSTYGQLAARLGDQKLAQAVGQAVGHNPLSIVVPCHRVVGWDGRLTGYAGGLERKRYLLELEEPSERKAARLF